jgi:hypothetical protein
MTQTSKPGRRRKPVVRDPWYVRARKHGAIATGVASLGVAAVAALSTSPLTVAGAADASDGASVVAHGDIITEALDGTAPKRASRSSAERAPLPSAVEAEAMIEGSLFAQKTVPVRADASTGSPVLATVAKGKQLPVTGKTRGSWTQVVHNDLPRWVATELVDDEEPKLAPAEGAISTAACARGSSVESGLQADTVRVYRAVCARFPEVASYGGLAGRGEHATGHSLDIMVRGQRIWTVQRGGEGWRGMSNRGGDTANHYDHVHVTTFGSSGSL